MSIFLTKDSKVIVQGMTGSEGTKHTTRMLASGTNIVGGVNPRKAGQSQDFDGKSVAVFGTVADAVKETGANVSVIFVPPKFTKDAVLEAVEAEVPLVVVITEGVPVHDTAAFFAAAQASGKTRIIGPNCPGIIKALELVGDVTTPLVVRLDGNNAEEGRRILAEANLPVVRPVDTMDGAAKLAAELAAAAA